MSKPTKVLFLLGKQLGENATTPHDVVGYFLEDGVTAVIGDTTFVPDMKSTITVCIAWDNDGWCQKELWNKTELVIPADMELADGFVFSRYLHVFERADAHRKPGVRRMYDLPTCKLVKLLRWMHKNTQTFNGGYNTPHIAELANFIASKPRSPHKVSMMHRFDTWLADGHTDSDVPFYQGELRYFVPFDPRAIYRR